MKAAKKPPLPRWWDPFAAILLIAAFQTVALRLAATRWTPELGVVQLLAFAGVIVGLALGQSRFSVFGAFLCQAAYGLALVPLRLMWLAEEGTGRERLLLLVQRIQKVFVEIASDGPLTDSILFVILMAGVFWALSAWAGFTLVRHAHAWRTIFPIGLVIFVIQFYYNCPYSKKINLCVDPGLSLGAWYLAVFLFFALLLAARVTYLKRAAEWRQSNTHISPEVSYDLMRYALGVVAALILLSWIIPTIKVDPLPIAAKLWQAAGTPMRQVSDWIGPFFESIRTSIAVPTDDFGQTLSLGEGGSLSEKPALTIETPGSLLGGVPYYWRNRVYDFYQDGGWKSTFAETATFNDGRLKMDFPPERVGAEVVFRFTPQKALLVLYTPSMPVAANLALEVEYAPADGAADVAALKAVELVDANETYQVRALLRNVTVEELQAAGAEYPDWVRERYLQLPAGISERTRQLAKEITYTAPTPYDMAQAVTEYLRANLEYVSVIQLPPAGREPLDWLLFDYKKGFCNYYASAEVILLRSLGIPARLAVGYAQGESQAPQDQALLEQRYQRGGMDTGPQTYLARGRDAHAWPEVYFPGIGWIEFEPTVSRAAIRRPLGENSAAPLDDAAPDEAIEERQVSPTETPDAPLFPPRQPSALEQALARAREGMARFWWLIALGVVVALLVWWAPLLVKLEASLRQFGLRPPRRLSQWAQAARRVQGVPLVVRFEANLRRAGLRPPRFLQQWARLLSLSPAARAYLEVNHALARVGSPPALQDTPAERVAALVAELPEVEQAAYALLAEYQMDAYSRSQSPNISLARRSAAEIRKLSWLVWFQRLLTGQ